METARPEFRTRYGDAQKDTVIVDWKVGAGIMVSEIEVFVDGGAFHKQIIGVPASSGTFTMFAPPAGRNITYRWR